MVSPTFHEWTAHLEQIGARVSVYRLTGARVRQRTLRSQVRARLGLGHPIAKARPEAVNGSADVLGTGETQTTKEFE